MNKAHLKSLTLSMPFGLRMKTLFVMMFCGEARRRSLMRELGARRKLTQPRASIEWYPRVDESRCTGCGICRKFCPKNVYAHEEGKAVVTRPYECVMLCSGCVPKCAAGAISFPDEKDFRKYVYYE